MKAHWLLWLLLGPVTGPLAGLTVHFWTHRQPLRAACCALGVVMFWVCGPMLLGAEMNFLARFH